MDNNIAGVYLWGNEICKLEWKGDYKKGFGKVGTKVSFSSSYNSQPFDLDPLGPFSKRFYFVQRGMSDILRADQDEGLPRFLSGSLPDEWGNTVFSLWIQHNNLRRKEITPVDKLCFIGKRGMGALEYIPQTFDPSVDIPIELEQLYILAKEIEQERQNISLNIKDDPSIDALMEIGTSAGGKHPKAIIAINQSTGEVRSGQVPQPEGFKYYILKFKDTNQWNTSEVEYAYYLMARDCKIEMEDSFLRPIGGDNHFVTERFDRKNGEKIHAATLYALAGEIHTYEDIFKVCRKLNLKSSEIEQLYRRAVFNFLSGVCDDHDKNFSFTLGKDGIWHLSPAYDVTFTVNILNPFILDRHCMSIGGEERKIGMSQLLRLAEMNDIKNAKETIRDVIEVVGSFESYAQRVGIDRAQTKIIADFIAGNVSLL